jgi:hypothetical protein
MYVWYCDVINIMCLSECRIMSLSVDIPLEKGVDAASSMSWSPKSPVFSDSSASPKSPVVSPRTAAIPEYVRYAAEEMYSDPVFDVLRAKWADEEHLYRAALPEDPCFAKAIASKGPLSHHDEQCRLYGPNYARVEQFLPGRLATPVGKPVPFTWGTAKLRAFAKTIGIAGLRMPLNASMLVTTALPVAPAAAVPVVLPVAPAMALPVVPVVPVVVPPVPVPPPMRVQEEEKDAVAMTPARRHQIKKRKYEELLAHELKGITAYNPKFYASEDAVRANFELMRARQALSVLYESAQTMAILISHYEAELQQVDAQVSEEEIVAYWTSAMQRSRDDARDRLSNDRQCNEMRRKADAYVGIVKMSPAEAGDLR